MIIHEVDQNTEEWCALRAGIPTASEASKLVTGTGSVSKSMSGYAKKLACDLYAGKPVDAWEGNKFTDRGHEIEDEAAAAYELATGYETIKVGFCTDDLQRYGASPDRFVCDDGLVEIKCLPKLHIDALLYYAKHKKCQPDRVPQTQMQMMVCEKAWCDLVFYHPDLPMLIIRQEPDSAFTRTLQEQLEACIRERDSIVEILKAF